MNKNPSVSVIVPMYKVEQYIKICVDSILAQTFQDFEIILVDDASPDNCFELCQKLYGGNDKIKFVRHEKNLGLGAARNTGMKHSAGKYIYFVDSDDYILPNALEKFYTVAEKNNAQVVHAASWHELFQDKPEPILQKNMRINRDRYFKEGFLPPNTIYRLEEHWKKYNTWSMAWLCFCRRDFLEKNKIQFLPIISEDEPFALTLYCLTERYYIICDALYVYRIRSGSITKIRNADKVSKSIRSLALGSVYVKNFLDRIQRFPNYEQWREGIMNSYIGRFLNVHMMTYYANLKLDAEISKSIETALTDIFGNSAEFVKYFFNGYNTSRLQTEILLRQNQQRANDNITLLNRFELSSNKIVFVNFMGRGYGCNPKYIAEEILRQNLPYDLVWLVNDLNDPMPKKIRKVKYLSVDAAYELATAKVIVTNVKNLLPFPGKKRGQYFIMTWHGGPAFKWVEKDAEKTLSPAYVAESKANSAITDLMMVNCQEQFEEFKRAFWYDGEILKCGIPRNDVFLRHDDKFIARVRESLNVPQSNKIVMYAPTFRNDFSSTDVYKFNAKKLLDTLKKRFGGKWTLLMRFHPNMTSTALAQANFSAPNIINVTNYPDMQELIVVSDVLISDYSSVIYDFMISNKPVFIFAKDYDTYPYERELKPLYFNLPYKVNRTEEELFACIKTFNTNAQESRIKAFMEEIKPFDNGHASETVVEKIKSVIGDKTPPPESINSSTDKTSPEELFRQYLDSPIFRNNIEYLMKVPIQENNAQTILNTLNLVNDKYFYELMDVRPWKPKILDVDSGIDELLATGKSLCRLGDGECKLMNGIPLDFQQCDVRLTEKLIQILSDAESNCYVGIPRYYWYIIDDIERNSNPYHKRYYTFQIPPIRRFFAEHCNKEKTYFDACLGGYMSNKSSDFCKTRFQKLKQLFNGRKVLIVAGETVFKNITHDFFDNVKQKEILLAPRINAWSHFDEILQKILTYPKDFVVALILGPTATVLAYELSKLGRTAYDIGHVPKDYDAFMKNADRSSAAIAKFYAAD